MRRAMVFAAALMLATPAYAEAPPGVDPACWKAANGLFLAMANYAAENDLKFDIPKGGWSALEPRLVEMAEELKASNSCWMSYEMLHGLVANALNGKDS